MVGIGSEPGTYVSGSYSAEYVGLVSVNRALKLAEKAEERLKKIEAFGYENRLLIVELGNALGYKLKFPEPNPSWEKK